MTTNTDAPPLAPPDLGLRPVTMEDVHRLVGALVLELDLLRRENARLRDLVTARHGDH